MVLYRGDDSVAIRFDDNGRVAKDAADDAEEAKMIAAIENFILFERLVDTRADQNLMFQESDFC